jgi:DNA-binding response OmpR family regulator
VRLPLQAGTTPSLSTGVRQGTRAPLAVLDPATPPLAPPAAEPPFPATLRPEADLALPGAGSAEHADEPRHEAPTVLLVEDNAELRAWIRSRLVGEYRVVEAADGAAALALAREIVPDIVVSDVMMPIMDGESLVRAIRADPHVDFLPVILLTARAGQESKLIGLHAGADDYLPKPFDVRELLLRIHNIIAARRRLRDRLVVLPATALLPGLAADADEARDRDLLERVRAVLLEHLADEEFTVDRLAFALAMSRATLYRKLQPLLEIPPMELIWRFRLEQAALWLDGTDASIGEIAYGVGFKSVPHFCTRFRDQFGVSPSGYRERRAS